MSLQVIWIYRYLTRNLIESSSDGGMHSCEIITGSRDASSYRLIESGHEVDSRVGIKTSVVVVVYNHKKKEVFLSLMITENAVNVLRKFSVSFVYGTAVESHNELRTILLISYVFKARKKL